ncbi:hypothetical protein JCM4020_37850 [Streptomyces coelicolor]|nr:hypothetical protein JCM4020_37850 [Streptomyces coelicolor]
MRALRSGLPAEAKVDFSTERAITTYKSNSLDGLAQALAESTEPGNVEVLDNLVIFASDIGHNRGPGPRRIARLAIKSDGWVACHISGDPSWVNAQTAVLRPLFEEARPRKWGFWYSPRWIFAAWGVSFALIFTALFDSLPLTVLIVLAGLACGFAIGSVLRRILKVEIFLTQDELASSYWRFTANEIVTAAIALLAIVVAVIFGVIAHNDSQDGAGETSGLARYW